MKKRKQDVLIGMGLLITSICFLLIASTSTTPLLKGVVTGDSATFQVIGKYWAQGILPYSQLWDLKGPLLFFINALGYMITGNRFGIFALQIAFLFATQFFAYKTFRIEFRRGRAFVLTTLMLFIVILDYYGNTGNEAEEYCLPFIMASFYFLYKWSKTCNLSVEHSPLAAFVYGVCIGVCVFIRATNALGVCAAVFVIFFVLVYNKKWVNLYHNLLAGLLGIAVIMLPFIIYFAYNGILYEMWDGTILYNISYAANSILNLTSMSGREVILLLIGYSSNFMLLITGIITFVSSRNKRIPGIMWLLAGGIMIYWLYHSLGSLHYAVVSLPYFCLSINTLYDVQRKCKKKTEKIGIFLFCSIYILINVWGAGYGVRRLGIDYYYNRLVGGSDYVSELQTRADVAISLLECIPAEDRKSVLLYNCYSGIYLQADICPANKYFTNQDWDISLGPKLGPKLKESMESSNVKYILVQNMGTEIYIQDILDVKYDCVASEPVHNAKNFSYDLYKIKEEK